MRVTFGHCGSGSGRLNRVDPAGLQVLDQTLRLEMIYDIEDRAVDVTIRPGPEG